MTGCNVATPLQLDTAHDDTGTDNYSHLSTYCKTTHRQNNYTFDLISFDLTTVIAAVITDKNADTANYFTTATITTTTTHNSKQFLHNNHTGNNNTITPITTQQLHQLR